MSDDKYQRKYGGYYVIDGIQERTCDSLNEPQKSTCKNSFEKYGFSLITDFSVGIPRCFFQKRLTDSDIANQQICITYRYRHLNKPIWIQTELSAEYDPKSKMTKDFDISNWLILAVSCNSS